MSVLFQMTSEFKHWIKSTFVDTSMPKQLCERRSIRPEGVKSLNNNRSVWGQQGRNNGLSWNTTAKDIKYMLCSKKCNNCFEKIEQIKVSLHNLQHSLLCNIWKHLFCKKESSLFCYFHFFLIISFKCKLNATIAWFKQSHLCIQLNICKVLKGMQSSPEQKEAFIYIFDESQICLPWTQHRCVHWTFSH